MRREVKFEVIEVIEVIEVGEGSENGEGGEEKTSHDSFLLRWYTNEFLKVTIFQ